MHDRHDGTPSPSPSENDRDLDPQPAGKGVEAIRRELYDAVVTVHFQPSPEEVQRAKEDPDNHWVPDYTPEQAGLTVHRFCGRWIAVWRSLEVEEEEASHGSEALLWTVLRIVPDPEGGATPAVQFLEI